eukprot:6214264-Pleurochrysis_carterae.AAC.2
MDTIIPHMMPLASPDEPDSSPGKVQKPAQHTATHRDVQTYRHTRVRMLRACARGADACMRATSFVHAYSRASASRHTCMCESMRACVCQRASERVCATRVCSFTSRSCRSELEKTRQW